ncbi:MAG: aminotransferase class I/II-fold pyridoxal phosphate-dependent enzyme [Oscillospiraceae bacterium]|nr:aminotransferase class I/II-fold pyridoxal phosphate-dependent enzyme [Oscillospiraceae bacterium]
MNTPIYNFIYNLNHNNILRGFMPGHKGKSLKKSLESLYQYDITEMRGADSLFEASGIIAESEKNASKLFGTEYTAYSASGSTLSIQAMLTLMKWEKRKAFAVRNIHRSFLNASALLDFDVEWIYPRYSNEIISGEINLQDIENKLKSCKEPSFLYITSPDYTGKIYDIKKIAEICHKYDSRLLVDNAHGALLAFMPENIHPIHLGADLCCDSAHKMLPALTGAGYIHTSRPEYAKNIKKAMLLYASTSPSYLTMMSLDLCNKYISENIQNDINKNLKYISELKREFANDIDFAKGEPFHLCIKNFNGKEFEKFMYSKKVECEYSDFEYFIMLMSPLNTEYEYKIISQALRYTILSIKPVIKHNDSIDFPEMKKAMSIREAVFAESEEISIEESLGRICAETNIPCPPAVPIAISGELITKETINIYKKYGIFTVNVVK